MSHPLGQRRLIWRCALADLGHEWPLNLCIVLSIAALLFPLAVLYGLKYGAVSVLENRLKQDPRSLELRPAASGYFSKEWLERQKNDPRVGFVVGLPRSIANTVRVVTDVGKVDASVLPTGSGDPLLVVGGLRVPRAGECVISSSLAREAKLQVGEMLTFLITRRGEQGWEEVSARLKVAGVLPEVALDYPALLAEPVVVESIEDYQDGLAVAGFGSKGETPRARPAFDGALVFPRRAEPGAKQDQDLAELAERLGGTGFTTVVSWAENLSSFSSAELERPVYYLSNANGLVETSNLDLLRAKLDEARWVILPWVVPREAALRRGASKMDVALLAWSPELTLLGLPEKSLAAGVWEGVLEGSSMDAPGKAELQWSGRAGELSIPLLVSNSAKDGQESPPALWLPAGKAGLLRRALERGVEWDNDDLFYTREGYAAFRLAARSLRDVQPLQERLEGEGIRILAETQRIADIQFLESQLSRIFGLFAAVAGAGATACLLAMAFSAAERKKRVLAFLQILGATRSQAARFPLYQCLVLSGAGAGVAWAGHAIFSGAVNGLFQARLLSGERLSDLPVEAVGWAVGVLLLISLGCYLLLIPRFVGLPLGEAAREP